MTVLDQQIENKEEQQRLKQNLESNEIVLKTLKDQVNALTLRIQRSERLDSDGQDKQQQDMDMKLIKLNDNISILQNENNKDIISKVNDKVKAISNNMEHRVSTLEN